MPWDGNRGNLEMVAGADDLLTYLDTEHQHRVTLHVIPSDHRHPLPESVSQLDFLRYTLISVYVRIGYQGHNKLKCG